MVRFIWMTHKIEKLTCEMEDIQAALKRTPDPNPYVIGHFDALNYLLSLVGNLDFPAKDPAILTNLYRSEEALFWLRKLHELLTLPLAKASAHQKYEEELVMVHQHECGVLRTTPATLAFSLAPPPELIAPTLHLWLVNLAQLHQEVKNELANPYGLTKAKSLQMAQSAHDTVLLFANLQPFTYASNRLGRLVENALRVNWLLPWKHAPNEGYEYECFIREVQNFNQTKMKPLLEKAKEMIATPSN